jgi:hypothetical protein
MPAYHDDESREAKAARQGTASSPRVNPLLEARLAYAEKGQWTFPLRFGTKVSHKSAEFSEGRKWGMTINPDEIRFEAKRWIDANIGLVTGAMSGVFVLETDTPEGHAADGAASLAALVAEHGDLPPTRQAISPSGSVHYYFQHPGVHVKNSVSVIGVGIDIRGDGGMCVAPPSAVPPREATADKPARAGGVYRWLNDFVPAPAPQWLLDRIQAGKETPEFEFEDDEPDDGFDAFAETQFDELYGRKILDPLTLLHNATAKLATTKKGGRNHWLNTWSFVLGRYIGAGLIPRSVVEASLWWACERNGLVSDKGSKSVEATLASGLNAGITNPLTEREQASFAANGDAADEAAASLSLGEWDAGLDDGPIPPRGWLLGNVFCRQFVSSLLGDGAIGKTALRYAQLLSTATQRQLSGEYVFQRCRVLIVSMEDGTDELRRRIKAARLHHEVELDELKGWLFLAAPGAKAGKLLTLDKHGRPEPGCLAAKLTDIIVSRKIDIVCLDPFVKTHSVEENNNSAIDKVVQILTDLAIRHDIAVDVPHHMSKGPPEPGNAKRGRGASAAKDAFRLVHTLTPMSPEEGQGFGLTEVERRYLVRMDPGKVNIAPPADDASWFKLVGVRIGNCTDKYPNGDEVQSVEPWNPPATFADITVVQVNQILNDIDAGLSDGNRYTDASKATERAAWRVIVKNIPGKAEGAAKKIIKIWRLSGLLTLRDYDNPVTRKPATGFWVDNAKRPS